MNNLKIIFALILTLAGLALNQEYGRGLLMDPKYYKDVPTKAPLMRGDSNNLPISFSIKKFTPTPGQQGESSTCAGWATAYACRTIIDAIQNNWNKQQATQNAYSPSFVYNKIRKNSKCDEGTSLYDALEVIKNIGSLSLSEFPYNCDKEVTSNDTILAMEHKIIAYQTIVGALDTNKIQSVKKSLSEFKPVVIAMKCPKSFNNVNNILNVWSPDSCDLKENTNGHALVVIGYDDIRYGGAFEILNSWGTSWGDNGYGWIRYSDFNAFVYLAFEVLGKPVIDSTLPNISGNIVFKDTNNSILPVKFNGNYFIMTDTLYSFFQFQIFCSINKPAYFYVFSTDLTNRFEKIFPFTPKMSDYFGCGKNNFAIPGEDYFNYLDETIGKDYFCFLFSAKKLPIDEIIVKIQNETGDIWTKINKVLGQDFVLPENIIYESINEINFNAKSSGKNIIPVLVEIKHN